MRFSINRPKQRWRSLTGFRYTPVVPNGTNMFAFKFWAYPPAVPSGTGSWDSVAPHKVRPVRDVRWVATRPRKNTPVPLGTAGG
jgi:hypothetical protein